MQELPFKAIPPIPEKINGTNIISRMIDGLGFRYYWATNGLTSSNLKFCPVEGSRDMIGLISHIYDLSYGTNKVLGGNFKKKELSEFKDLREETLALYWDTSKRLKEMDPDDLENYNYMGSAQNYPFWYLLNGQIADALTHVGQVVSWRRIDGNPQETGVNVFLGKKM
ncbi:hypothetical protein [Flammeovirga kamogawensis]|uniref:DinB family protein n=1 Tax=Flammeovirga kamogawensis TaxID=373891 RepID=A0ABX8H1D2_9BACT|nr:hypothetical protein [Flammeovirga kamogawensis]MBB6462325.1 hypothetical protein [Flammeovirga kamogawensis]QWG09443.1 hypothetical protein KM029_22815 [Flammeovirga kamogawensis]TRX64958.1 hypothetical protein EO216_20715 [Flammeovirga kamogawensis]